MEVSVTSKGRRKLRRAPQAAQERLLTEVESLSAADRVRLADLLERVARGMAIPIRRPAMFFEEAKRSRKRSR